MVHGYSVVGALVMVFRDKLQSDPTYRGSELIYLGGKLVPNPLADTKPVWGYLLS